MGVYHHGYAFSHGLREVRLTVKVAHYAGYLDAPEAGTDGTVSRYENRSIRPRALKRCGINSRPNKNDLCRLQERRLEPI
ncbi:MAG TPA: hypothetical protein D7I13_01625 [Candidatus Poseidoniales archaeon]|nr:MAG TPA: hypothetical protein D7I13_01625 [Candidatus Poseidoniales archaeon]